MFLQASIGKLGSVMHSITDNHQLSSWLKERYGGLKKLIEMWPHIYNIGADHPFNPSVRLISAAPVTITVVENPALQPAIIDNTSATGIPRCCYVDNCYGHVLFM